MSFASVIVAAALAAWGPVAPAPEEAEAAGVAAPEATPAPAAGEVEPIAPAPPPAATAAPRPSIVAKAPLDVRVTPAVVAAPRPASPPSKPLHKQWLFWTIAGGFFASTIVITYAATRPKPEPYTGNAPPFFVSFP